VGTFSELFSEFRGMGFRCIVQRGQFTENPFDERVFRNKNVLYDFLKFSTLAEPRQIVRLAPAVLRMQKQSGCSTLVMDTSDWIKKSRDSLNVL